MDPEKVEKGGQVQRAQKQQDDFRKPADPKNETQQQSPSSEKSSVGRDAA